MTQGMDADVAIIGGGVIGLACAYELASANKRVVVLERDRPGSGAGHVAAGMLAPISEADGEDEPFIQLALESCGLYPDWIQRIEADSGLGCGYRDEGSLLVALHRDHEVEWERLAGIQRRLSLESRRLDRAEVLEREPYLSPRVVSGLFVPGDKQVNPRRLTKALAVAIEARGGTVVGGEPLPAAPSPLAERGSPEGGNRAEPLIEGGRCVGASMGDVEVRAEVTVVAAGAWSGEVWPEGAGVLPMRPVKGQILRLRGEPLLNHVLRTPDVYLVPREDGELVVGATTEEQGFDTRVTTWAVMDLLREAWRVLPGVAELEMAEAIAGLRPALRDHQPAIGRTAIDGLFVATGHYRHGIVLAPITARLLAGVLDGTATVPPAFDPIRLSGSSSPQAPRPELAEGGRGSGGGVSPRVFP